MLETSFSVRDKPLARVAVQTNRPGDVVVNRIDDDVSFLVRLSACLAKHGADMPGSIALTLAALRADGLDRLPGPGQGRTLFRWQVLAEVAACDLGLAKLYEAHTDALAIYAEIAPDIAPPSGIGAVWASEQPDAKVHLYTGSTQNTTAVPLAWQISGAKAWCSGASMVDYGLLTANTDSGLHHLVCVDMDALGITRETQRWHAVGMSASATQRLIFDATPVRLVGDTAAYLHRPGFWQGGIGVAVCWYGACVTLAQTLRARAQGSADPHRSAHLGAVDMLMTQLRALIHEAARIIDARPVEDMFGLALRVRCATADAAARILEHSNRGVGPATLCEDARYARIAADLPVFIRQCQAERDQAALGALLEKTPEEDAKRAGGTWTL